MARHHSGFVLLYIVLVIAAVTAAASFTLATQTSLRLGHTRQVSNYDQARYVAMSCAEKLLMDVRNDTSLVTSGSLSIVGGTCTYSVTGTEPNKTILVSGEYENLYADVQVVTTQTSPTITAVWLEGDF